MKPKKRILSAILSFVMLLQVIVPVFATNNVDTSQPAESTTISEVDKTTETKTEQIGETETKLVEPEKLTMVQAKALTAQATNLPSEADGTKIETINVSWITEDSKADNNPDQLNQTWTDNDSKYVRMKLNFALSGQHDYPEGTVNIEIPKYIFKDRNGKVTGNMTLAVPEAPDKSGLFAYVDNGDTYILTNTKRLPAATSGMIETTIRDLTPSQIKDYATGYVTDNFNAKITVNTNSNNKIEKVSNDINAIVDTFAKISGAYKNGQKPREAWHTSFPDELKPSNPEKYVFVEYDVHAFSTSNQPSIVEIVDESSSEVLGPPIVLGYKNSKTGVVVKGNGTNTLTDSKMFEGFAGTGQNFFGKVYVAYPNEKVQSGVQYKLDNKVTFNMTALDDGEKTTTSATASVNYMKVLFELPEGHFIVKKEGTGPTTKYSNGKNQGIYSYALNQLKDGKDVEIKYNVYTDGFGFKWTVPLDKDAKDINNYKQVPYKMITTDYSTFFDKTSEDLTSKEFEFSKLTFYKPSIYDYIKYDKDGTGYYESDRGVIEYGKIQEGYYGYILDQDNNHIPDFTVSISENGTDFKDYATVSFKTGSPVITKLDGTKVDGDTLDLPANTIDYKVSLETKVPAIKHKIQPTVKLKVDGVKNIVDNLFAVNDTPQTYSSNTVKLDTVLYNTDVYINKDMGTDILGSFQYGSKLTKSLKYDGTTQQEKINRNVKLHYSSTFSQHTNLQVKSDLDEVIKEGLLEEQKVSTWYDLLPQGVIPNTRTLSVTNGKILDVELVFNYKDTNRTLMIVKTETEPKYTYGSASRSILDIDGYRRDIKLSFDANYSWESLSDFGVKLDNVIAFQGDTKELGNTKGLKGEPDNPLAGENKYSKDGVSNVADIMTNLDPNSDTPVFNYAHVSKELVVDTYALTSVQKQVDVNGEGLWGDGLDNAAAKNVYENGLYSYRLRLKNPEISSARNIKLYDNLENYVPSQDKEDYGDTQWRGKFLSVDVSQLESKGIKPVVYYSTQKGLVLDNEADLSDNDLTNTAIWSTTMPADKSTITAIAIDASKAKDGSDFVLGPSDSIAAFIKMQAPIVSEIETVADNIPKWYDTKLADAETEEGLAGGAHAYNNVSSTHISISEEDKSESDNLLVRHDYVKVGLKPYSMKVIKSWKDDNNRDGIRPESAKITLLANGKPTEKVITLDDTNKWTGTFDNILFLDENAKEIKYTLQEETTDGYKFVTDKVYDNGAYEVHEVSNVHEPEKITVSGTKTWKDDQESDRPESITINLYANDKINKTVNIRPDAEGNWKYSFDNLFKYENGKEIKYEVKESNVSQEYYSVKKDNFDIENVYYPFGDVSLTKEVINKTDKTSDLDFTFTFYAKQGEEFDTTEYEYWTSDGRVGKIVSGGEFTLKDNEKIVIRDISVHSKVEFVEKEKAGFTLLNTLSTDVKANQTSDLIAKNEYNPKGEIPIKGTKILENRKLEPYQFIFDIYNEEGKIVRSGSSTSDGDILFGSFKFTYDDIGKTYNYTIKERDLGLKGYTTDPHEEKFSIRLEDNGDGTINVVPTFDEDGIVFKNVYEAKGVLSLTAGKVIKGNLPVNAGEFNFVVKDKESDKELAQGVNDEKGIIEFSDIEFDQSYIGKKFTLVASEIKGDNPNIIYDESTVEYDVEVFDNGDGTLSFNVTTRDMKVDDAKNEVTSPVFYNQYKDGSLTVKKFITSGDPTKDFKFKIKLTGQEDLIPDGDFELVRKQVESPYKINFDMNGLEGSVPDPIYIHNDKSGNHTFIVPKVENIEKWTSNKDGSGIVLIPDSEGTYTVEIDGKVSAIKVGENDLSNMLGPDTTFYANTNVKPGRIMWKVEGDTLTIYPENGVVGRAVGVSTGKNDIYDYDFPKAILDIYNADTGQQEQLPLDNYNIENIKTEGILKFEGSLQNMFFSCLAQNYDLSSFDTTNVTNMSGMFMLAGVVDTPGVRSMSYMFGDSKATSLDLSSFDTSNVTDMSLMFYESQATSLDLSNFDTSNVTDMLGMFANSKATSLDLSSFDTSQVTNMYGMFENSQATSLDLSSFDTSNVTDMSGMFSGSQATSLDLSSFDTSSVTDMSGMFAGSQATSLDLSSFDTSNVTSMEGMFAGSQATSLDLSRFDTSNVTNMTYMFASSRATTGYARTQADADKFNASSAKPETLTFVVGGTGYKPPVVKTASINEPLQVNNVQAQRTRATTNNLMQPYAATPTETPYALSKGYITKANTVVQSGTQGGVTWEIYDNGHMLFRPTDGVSGVFNNMSSYSTARPWSSYDNSSNSLVKSISFENGVKGGSNVSYMFNYSQATTLDLSNFDTSNVTNMSSMFDRSQATSLDLSSFDTSSVTNMSNMFYFSQATSLDLSNFDTSNVTDMSYIFASSRATSLDLSSFNTSKVTNMRHMFQSSQATTLDLSNFDTSNVTNMSRMFQGSQSTSLDLSSFDTSKVTNMSSMFNNSKAQKLELSPNFEFEDTNPPTISTTTTYTGKWIREDKAYGPYTAQELATEFNKNPGALAGTWIAEKVPTEYKVLFDSNTGTGSLSPMIVEKDVKFMLPKDGIMKFNHVLKEWNTSPDGSGTSYNVTTEVSNLTTPTNEITLYAIWEPQDNTVKFENGEATFVLKHGESVTLENLPAGLGYEIYEESESGWVLVETRNTEGTIESNKETQSTFVNAYKPGQTSVQLQARKNLDGIGAENFDFTLTGPDNYSETAKSLTGGAIKFRPIVYTKPGTYQYSIKELVTTPDPSINYDTHQENITVTVTDDGKGNLTAKVQYDTDGAVFNNTTKTGSLAITKQVTGTSRTNDVFNFEVTVGSQIHNITLTNKETKTLDNIKYGTPYSVREVSLPDNYTLESITNSSGVIGEKSATSTVVAKNIYTTNVSVPIISKKVLEGRSLKSGEFTFIVEEEKTEIVNSKPTLVKKTLAQTNNDADGNIDFGLVNLSGLGRHKLVIRELPGNLPNIKYDNNSIIVTVDVVENADGSISTKVNYPADNVFNNKYTPDVPEENPKFGNVSITKQVLNYTEALKDKEYPVVVSLLDTNGKPLEGEYELSSNLGLSTLVKHDSTINIKKDEILTINNLPVGTKVSIKENVPEGFNLLSQSVVNADVTENTTAKLTLINEYNPVGSFRFEGNKSLYGADIKDFRFKFMVLKDGEVIQRVENDESGKILFEDIALTYEDIGKTYTYEIFESDDKQDNIIYDKNTFEVKVTISDDGKGNIVATVDTPTIAFSNGYKMLPTTGTNKTLLAVSSLIGLLAIAIVVDRRKNKVVEEQW